MSDRSESPGGGAGPDERPGGDAELDRRVDEALARLDELRPLVVAFFEGVESDPAEEAAWKAPPSIRYVGRQAVERYEQWHEAIAPLVEEHAPGRAAELDRTDGEVRALLRAESRSTPPDETMTEVLDHLDAQRELVEAIATDETG